jgi:acid stress-induced BolA-like protein IbaG/YrbA
MALQILNAGPPPEDVAEQIRAAIAAKLPKSAIDVRPQGPGHFEITVTDVAFDGLNRVKQQQLVYGAITELMAGQNPAVHAVDRLECLVP